MMKTKETILKENLLKAFEELNNHWLEAEDSESLNKNYPFKKCFNELTTDVKEWAETK